MRKTHCSFGCPVNPAFGLARRRLAVILLLLLAFVPGAALAQVTERARTHFREGLAAMEAGRMVAAADSFREAARLFELSPGDAEPVELPATLNNLGTALANQNESVRAIPVLRRALALIDTKHPGVATIAGNLARVHLDLGEYGAAEPLIDQALRLAEDHRSDYQPFALAMRARLRLWRRQFDTAVADIDRAIQLEDTSDPVLRANLRHIRGLALEAASRNREAIRDLAEAVRIAAEFTKPQPGLDLPRLQRDFDRVMRRQGSRRGR
jgi:tetratricopeptide (TPR) repeat protein